MVTNAVRRHAIHFAASLADHTPADAVEAIRIRGQYATNGSRAFWVSTYLRGLSGYAYARLIADVRDEQARRQVAAAESYLDPLYQILD
jgi:hypothetical protein